MIDAIETIDAFSEYLPLSAVRVAPGEYEIKDRKGRVLWKMEGASLADWVAASCNGYSAMRTALDACGRELRDFQNGYAESERRIERLTSMNPDERSAAMREELRRYRMEAEGVTEEDIYETRQNGAGLGD